LEEAVSHISVRLSLGRRRGHAVEISGQRRGKVGATPWKFRRNAVENSALSHTQNAERRHSITPCGDVNSTIFYSSSISELVTAFQFAVGGSKTVDRSKEEQNAACRPRA